MWSVAIHFLAEVLYISAIPLSFLFKKVCGSCKSKVKVSRDRPRWPKGFRVDYGLVFPFLSYKIAFCLCNTI